jgi:hypothetical protein
MWLNIGAFPHILGSFSSYMTLHPIQSGFFLYIGKKFSYFFISIGKLMQNLKTSIGKPLQRFFKQPNPQDCHKSDKQHFFNTNTPKNFQR